MKCDCGGKMYHTGQGAFVEIGEWNGKTYEDEGGGDILRCIECSKTIIDYDVDPSQMDSDVIITSEDELACEDYCIQDSGATCNFCERYEDTNYRKKYKQSKKQSTNA